MQLDKLLHRKYLEQIREEQIGRGVFREWKARYSAHLAGYIRNAVKMRERGIPIPNDGFTIPWCNAAMLILDSAPEDIAADFMLGDRETKDEFVNAVLKDGGVENLSGFFVQVPQV